MTTAEFIAIWADRDLKQYIVDQARRHSRNPELQKEFIQEAALCISLDEFGDGTVDYYKTIARRAIQKLYQRERRYRIRCEEVIARYEAIYAYGMR